MAPSARRPRRAGALHDLAPWRILKQIAVLQTLYYIVAFVLILFTALVAGEPFSLSLLWNWKTLRGDTTVGWTLSLCWLMDSVVGVVFLLIFVNRSKLIPDFALTLHVLHLIVVSFYTREFPSNYLWWGLMVISAVMMTFLGIWACQWRELQPLAFGGSSNAAKTGSAAQSAAANGHLESGGSSGGAAKVESAIGRILGHGRRADMAGGSYEMVRMRDEDGAPP